MMSAPDLNSFDVDAALLGNPSQAANEGVNTPNTFSTALVIEGTVSEPFIPLRMNLCISPL